MHHLQPLPFQPGASFDSVPVGSGQHGSGSIGGSGGSGFRPRNIDIRIRTGALTTLVQEKPLLPIVASIPY